MRLDHNHDQLKLFVCDRDNLIIKFWLGMQLHKIVVAILRDRNRIVIKLSRSQKK